MAHAEPASRSQLALFEGATSRARRRMQRLAPPLLDRCLRSLRGELF